MFRIKRKNVQSADLDITAFLNLMIVLVPVLLLSMVFSQITVLDFTLPEGAGAAGDPNLQQVELIINESELLVNYPRGTLLKRIPKLEQGAHDFDYLALVLQEVKRQLKEKEINRRSITILSAPETEYQTIISAVDTVRSFKAVVAASVVDAELFPEISFGDAPTSVNAGGKS